MQSIELVYWLGHIAQQSTELREMVIEHTRVPLNTDPELLKKRSALWREIAETVVGLDRKITAESLPPVGAAPGGN